MDKFQWKKIDKIMKSSNKPSARWGHSCCVVGEELVVFGGFADSNYMNDLWSYNPTTMSWREIKTHGDIPDKRSNCTMNYDVENNRIILFGGGCQNKQRINCISMLDWLTKEWMQIPPAYNQPAPLGRTYHSAEFRFPYLVIFGGESIDDLGDLWVFSLLQMQWKQIISDFMDIKPHPRRFHSSALIGNVMFIIAGCHAKYRCLGDVYSIDLTSLFEKGQTKDIRWIQHKLTGNQYLPRWGHTSTVYNNKIYLFGGRFSNDLNDLLVIDVSDKSIKPLKVVKQLPSARRRHCSSFIGSNLVCFGGFDGNYFNDLFYINLFELKKNKAELEPASDKIRIRIKADMLIRPKIGQKIQFCKGIIADYFPGELQFNNFIADIEQFQDFLGLCIILQNFKQGFGILNMKFPLCKYQCRLPQQKQKPLGRIMNMIGSQNTLKNACLKTTGERASILSLNQEEFDIWKDIANNFWFSDITIVVNNTRFIKSNLVQLSSRSDYFKHLFSMRYYQTSCVDLEIPEEDIPNLEIILLYLRFGVLVVPDSYNQDDWMSIYRFIDYFSIIQLISIVEVKICEKVTAMNFSRISHFAGSFHLQSLALDCGYAEMKSLIQKFDFRMNFLQEQIKRVKEREQDKKFGQTSHIYRLIKFDLTHLVELKSSSLHLQKNKSLLRRNSSASKENIQQNSF